MDEVKKGDVDVAQRIGEFPALRDWLEREDEMVAAIRNRDRALLKEEGRQLVSQSWYLRRNRLRGILDLIFFGGLAVIATVRWYKGGSSLDGNGYGDALFVLLPLTAQKRTLEHCGYAERVQPSTSI